MNKKNTFTRNTVLIKNNVNSETIVKRMMAYVENVNTAVESFVKYDDLKTEKNYTNILSDIEKLPVKFKDTKHNMKLKVTCAYSNFVNKK